MVACAGMGIPCESKFIVSPSETVAKKLPDRTISPNKRVVLDVRRLNPKCPKTDYRQGVTPPMEDLAMRYCYLETSAPGAEIVGAKMDIDAACTMCRLHPDSSALLGADFELSSAPCDNLVFFYLVLPFGFARSVR